jgi:hypothetical protein
MRPIVERIAELLDRSATDGRVFPPTVLYEEGWMLWLVLDWFSRNRGVAHPLAIDAGSRWYSEALLTSVFLSRRRGDPHGESHTHADGVIGQFTFDPSSRAGLCLDQAASVFKVIEAKMFSALSRRTTHAPGYNQAARTVACMAETLCRANRSPRGMADIGFYVLAPEQQIELGLFRDLMRPESIAAVVRARAEGHEEPKVDWFETAFQPMLANMTLACLSWEGIVDFITDIDRDFGLELGEYYAQCLVFNRTGKPKA